MTLWAKRTPHGDRIEIAVTSGPVSFSVIEDPGHVRHFWGQLGVLLEQAEAEAKAAAED
jgi:hypothetical protein